MERPRKRAAQSRGVKQKPPIENAAPGLSLPTLSDDFIEDGQITLHPVGCVAVVACDDCNYVMLVRRRDESSSLANLS